MLNPSSTLVGLIDEFTGSEIRGWVSTNGNETEVNAFYKNEVIATTIAKITRKDLSSRKDDPKGFLILLPSMLNIKDIISGDVQLKFKCQEKEYAINVWSRILDAQKFDELDLSNIKSWFKFLQKNKGYVRQPNDVLSGYGCYSADRSVQLGRNGYLFLSGGSNNAAQIYDANRDINIQKWYEIIKSRQESIKTNHTKFLQIIIPEKSSVLFDYTPFPATNGSKHYNELCKTLEKDNLSVLNLLPILTQAQEKKPTYLLGDSHFTSFGALISALEILKNLSIHQPELDIKWIKRLRIGDLSSKFYEFSDCREIEEAVTEIRHNSHKLEPTLVKEITPSNGHIGIHRVFRNQDAPIKKSIICFGNSFFERGGASSGLTWWFSRLFSEFHFIWATEPNFEYIREQNPDIVLCQTIERFLGRAPGL